MNDLTKLETMFRNVASANGRRPLENAQFQEMVNGESPAALNWLGRLVDQASQGEPAAIERFMQVHSQVRITHTLKQFGFQDIDKVLVKELIAQHGESRILNATRELVEGAPDARDLISEWIGGTSACGKVPATTRGNLVNDIPPSLTQIAPPPNVRTSRVRPATDRPTATVTRLHPSDASRDQSGRRPSATVNSPPPRVNADQHGARAYDQHNCFGKDVAVQFSNLPTQDGRSNTVMIKIARAKGKTCKEGVDWNKAILINLESHEVQTCCHLLSSPNAQGKVRYAGHGATNDKWFEMVETADDWAGSIRLSVGQGDDRRAINIGPTDVGKVAALFMRALKTQLYGVSDHHIDRIIARAFDLYQRNVAASESRRGRNGTADGGQPRGQQGSGYGQRRHG